ncbi:lipase family protein [Oricola cellulosilytica]|uniref:Uncharacterized protein n=1 Tax=Oricola cellulosilytica TaxID=1429082 RepID=A0A4R0PBD3_9HYPH|nr:hypothetical protein [Oricola cellulosilytica]TCD13722.1 hypothetical protein E0D97_11470 [Oricola cellulosilytica]
MRILAALCSFFLVSGCWLSPPDSKFLVRDPARSWHPLEHLENGQIDPLLTGLSQYALLSAAAYDDDVARLAPRCEAPSRHAQRWKRLSEYSQDYLPAKPAGKVTIPGFAYQVWEDRGSGPHARVALAFRGTNFTELGDWHANAGWLTRFSPVTYGQYQQTRDLVDKLVPDLKRRFGDNVEIIATGHSLGGGLAQHAAYSSKDISLVYAFATSPVTGYTISDPRLNGANRKGVRIFRVYEAGEVLSTLRWGSRQLISLSTADPQVKELRFNFRTTFKRGSKGGGPIGQHSIAQLACDLICRAELGGSRAQCLAT